MKLENYLKENKILDESLHDTEGLGYSLDITLDSYSGCRIRVSNLEHNSDTIDAMEKYYNATEKLDKDKRKIFGDKFLALQKKFNEIEIIKRKKTLEQELKRMLDTVSVLIKAKVEQEAMRISKEFDKMIIKVTKEVK